MHFLTRQVAYLVEARHRLIPYADLIMAWLAITLFGTTISLFSGVLNTNGKSGDILNFRAGKGFASRRPQLILGVRLCCALNGPDARFISHVPPPHLSVAAHTGQRRRQAFPYSELDLEGGARDPALPND